MIEATKSFLWVLHFNEFVSDEALMTFSSPLEGEYFSNHIFAEKFLPYN